MSSPVNHLGGGQMSSYTIFHRGADVRGGKCATLTRCRCTLSAARVVYTVLYSVLF